MKTIYTTLPIFKALKDQAFQRGKANGAVSFTPVYTPKHRLPSFQWKDDGDSTILGFGVSNSVVEVYLVDANLAETAITIPITLYTTVAGDDYFIYNGDTLDESLPQGDYYLKIIMASGHVYYSDWFRVDCVYCNFASTFTGGGFTVTDMEITYAGGASYADSTPRQSVYLGQAITVLVNLAGISASFAIYNNAGHRISNIATAVAGINELTLITDEASDDCFIRITATGNFTTSEVLIYTQYACGFVTLSFTNCCNVGDILYEDDFIQTLWIKSDSIEQAYPYVEKGQENGEGKFIPTFRRQEKNFLIRMPLVSQYMVDVLQRLKMHDVMTYIDQVGDAFNVEGVDVEHTWQFDDKYYATVDLTLYLGDAVVTSGCC